MYNISVSDVYIKEFSTSKTANSAIQSPRWLVQNKSYDISKIIDNAIE